MKTSRSKRSDKESLDAYISQQIRKGLEEARAEKLVDYEKVRSDWMKRLGSRPSR
jgi:hypothetical protein